MRPFRLGFLVLAMALASSGPATAQSIFFPATSGGGAPANPDIAEEYIGYSADGTTVNVLSGTSSNGEAASPTTIGTNSNACAGFRLQLGPTTLTTGRFGVDLSIDGGSTYIINDLYLEGGAGAAPVQVYFPLNIPAGRTIVARVRATSANAPVRVGLKCNIRTAASPPLFDNVEVLTTFVTATTYADDTDVPLVNSASTSYTTIINSTPRAYGAMLFTWGYNGVVPAAQQVKLSFATGVLNSETEFLTHGAYVTGSVTPNARGPMALAERPIPASQRISVKAAVASPGTDAIRVQGWGFY